MTANSREEQYFRDIITETNQILSDYKKAIDRIYLAIQNGEKPRLTLNRSSVKQKNQNTLVLNVVIGGMKEKIELDSGNYTIKNDAKSKNGKGVLTNCAEILPNTIKAVLKVSY